MDKFSFIGNSEIDSIDKLYTQYKSDPNSIDVQWQKFFEGFEFAQKFYKSSSSSEFEKEFKVINLINAYRKRGHLFTTTNPVRQRRKYFPTLDLENYELSDEYLDQEFHAGKEIGIGKSLDFLHMIRM